MEEIGNQSATFLSENLSLTKNESKAITDQWKGMISTFANGDLTKDNLDQLVNNIRSAKIPTASRIMSYIPQLKKTTLKEFEKRTAETTIRQFALSTSAGTIPEQRADEILELLPLSSGRFRDSELLAWVDVVATELSEIEEASDTNSFENKIRGLFEGVSQASVTP